MKRKPFLWASAVLFILYLLLPNPGLARGRNIDTTTNAISAWHFGVHGSLVVPAMEDVAGPPYRGVLLWFVDSNRGPVSQYPPGTAVLGSPFYALFGREAPEQSVRAAGDPAISATIPVPPSLPGRAAAGFATSTALGLLGSVARRAGVSTSVAVTAVFVAGLTTPFWTVAAGDLWSHSAGVLSIALGLWAASRERWVIAGAAFGFGATVRPHILLIAVGVGLWASRDRRDRGPALQVGITSAAGLTVLLLYNWWLWGRLTISGGYSSELVENLRSPDLGEWALNIAGGLFDPTVGLLVLTPIVGIACIAVFVERPSDGPWLGAAVGGLAYLLIQYKANRYSGGSSFLGYRYPLEALAAALPLFIVSIDRVKTRSRVWTMSIVGALLLGVTYFTWLAIVYRLNLPE